MCIRDRLKRILVEAVVRGYLAGSGWKEYQESRSVCGVPLPEGRVPPVVEAPRMLPALPGQSLTPLLRAGAGIGHGVALVENDEDYLGLRLRTLITSEHKLTIYADQPFGELFDLVNDPDELHNRFHDPDWRAVRARLAEQLLSEVVRTDSTLPSMRSGAGDELGAESWADGGTSVRAR